MIISVTGKSGSGKSTFCQKLAHQINYFYVDIDSICHEILKSPEVTERLLDIYGESVFVDGELDRKLLGDLVFENRHADPELTNYIWKQIQLKIDWILISHENIILDWLLLPHTKYWSDIISDIRILMNSDTNKRIEKVLERDNISREYFNKRESASIECTDYDICLTNDYTETTLTNNIKFIEDKINEKSRRTNKT